jgi:protein-tyrosine phosphatase
VSSRVLTVCVGNVCRSPVAERLLRGRLPEEFEVTSAGTRGMVGRSMTPEAEAELVGLGGSAAGFVARRLNESHIRDADLVLTATTGVRRAVLEEVPAALRRTFTWRELAALVDGRTYDDPAALVADAASRRGETAGLDLDTEDPIGRSAEVYARVTAQIDEAITTIARALTRGSAQ